MHLPCDYKDCVFNNSGILKMDTEDIDPPFKSTKIICTSVPLELIDKNIAKKHFRQFGRVLRILIRPKSRVCTVEYDCPENAEVAILNAGEYMGQSFEVNWHEEPAKKKKVKKDPDPDWTADPEIQSELDAMALPGSAGFKKKSYNLRPEGMAVDPAPVKAAAAKIKKRIWKAANSKKAKSKISPVGVDANAWTPEQLDLLSTLKQPAFTAEEKYKVLEARDKLIRLRTKKHTDLTKATHTVGTCPDMCPEKERLMREAQHQVALYEQDASGRGMNSMLAIKQYSRSSADQEAPLPHELRPVSVLQLTMGYLMHRIMNLCDSPDVNLADWFHFLWDRTRSIRKDITQQELCCQGSVALIEQCARFHIHCSARLVAEDASVFDQKINTENLTKCLQTLKYMYHDLHLKGESCPNEAEFRAYIILLNLNDGNFMWEVQQLKLEIQKSPEVKFALSVYSAINKNNFVKFFKLVKSTGYLNACILLRYFVQVRTRALSAIVKCYSPRMPYTQFSIAELKNLLAFEDIASTVDFIVFFGLYLNTDETQIVLDRKKFKLPEMQYALERAIEVVESKRRNSVGEVIYGGHLPPRSYENYIPFNSFDESGVFIVTGILSDMAKEAEYELLPSDSQDQADSAAKSTSLPQIAQRQTTDQATSSNVYGTKIPSLLDIKVPDPSQPFWSIKGELSTDTKNIFKDRGDSPLQPTLAQPKSDEIFKSSPFAQKPSIFRDSQKQSIFGEQKKSSIFEEKKESPVVVPNIFGSEFKKSDENRPQCAPPKPNVSDPKSIFAGQQSIFKMDRTSTAPGMIDSKDVMKAKFTNIFNEVAAQQPQSLPSIIKPYAPTARLPVKSPQEDKQLAEKLKHEEQEKLLKQQKEKEEKLRREIEEMKKKAELRKQQLEEEKRRKEKKRLEKERQRRLEEDMRIAALKEKERQLALEIKQSVTQLMDELLTKVEVVYKNERLAAISQSIKKHKMSQFVQKWKRKIAVNKRKRQAMDQNPIWLPSRTATEEAQELFTDTQSLALQNIKRYKYGRSFEVSIPEKIEFEHMDVHHLYKILVNSYSKIYVRPQKEIFWKVTVSLPDFRELKVGLKLIEDVLIDFFQWKDRYGSTAVVDQYKVDKNFGYAVEKKQGMHVTESSSNGLLFISHEPTEVLFQRIAKSLKSFPNLARIPIAIILVNNNTSSINAQTLGKVLESDRHITNYDILACKFTKAALVNAVKQSLEFLAKFIEKPPPLELNTLQSFLHVHLATELWKRISSYAAWNSKYKSCLKSPPLVISLYNDGVEKLKAIALDKFSLEYPDFPDEFDKFLMEPTPEVLPCDYRYFPQFWKLDTYRSLLMNTINSLKLPKYQSNWPPENETDLEQNIFVYCSQIFKQPEPIFYKIMAAILRHIDPVDEFYKVKDVLWTNIMEVITLEKLRETNFSLYHTEFHSKSIFQQLFVVYDVKSLDKYCSDEWFYLKNPLVEAEIRRNETAAIVKDKREVPMDVFDDFDLDELEKSIRGDDEIVRKKSEIEELESFMADLEESMEIHKKINANFQHTVEMALNIKK